jgi:hypothetical protein
VPQRRLSGLSDEAFPDFIDCALRQPFHSDLRKIKILCFHAQGHTFAGHE